MFALYIVLQMNNKAMVLFFYPSMVNHTVKNVVTNRLHSDYTIVARSPATSWTDGVLKQTSDLKKAALKQKDLIRRLNLFYGLSDTDLTFNS